MHASFTRPASTLTRDLLRWIARQVLLVSLIALAVSGALILLFRQDVRSTLIYCFSISICCSFCIQGLHRLAARLNQHLRRGRLSEDEQHWAGWPVMIPILIVGTAVGYTAGTELGNVFTGYKEVGPLGTGLRQGLSMMLISLIPGLAVTYFFVSRGRLAAAMMRAETAQRQAAEHQLRLLESQLEPHMLFNTLANLRVLIGMDPPRAQAMLDQLIAFLRATLSASRSGSHPLREEFARLQDYLALMKIRMGERLQPVFDLPPELAELAIPPLLLQPLVENAIKHGLEPKIEGGELRVGARREGGRLILEVRDGGIGLGRSAGDGTQEGTQFGLHQVRERLATRYGAAATLVIAPAPGSGTLVTLTLPLP